MSFIGRQIDVGIGKETVRGTAVAPTYWLPAMVKDIEDVFELAKDAASRGVIETDTDAKLTKRWSEGSVEMLLRDESIGLIMLAALGSVATTPDNPEVGVNTHNFTVSESVQHPSLTVELKNPAQQIAFTLGMITTLDLVVELGNFVRATLGLMGKKGAAAVNAPAYVVENEFVPQHVTVKFATNLAGLGAAAAIKAKTVNLTVTKNVETDDIVGSTDPNDVLNKQFQINGTVELLYEDTTHKAIAVAGTPQAMRITVKNTDVTIGASSNPTVEIDLAKVVLEEWTRDSGADDLIRQTLNFNAYFSVADSKMVTAKVVNTVTSY